jgi:hypothetical protein
LSKTGGIASYFEEFANEASVKDWLKLRCQNVKLFLREPFSIPGSPALQGRQLPFDIGGFL